MGKRAAGVVLILIVAITTALAGPFGLTYVPTSSMEPTIPSHSALVTIEATGSQPASTGDIIVYSTPDMDKEIIHRVVQTTEEGYITQGDALDTTDQQSDTPPISPSSVQSITIQLNGSPIIIPGLGTVYRHVGGLGVFTPALLTVLFLISLLERDIRRYVSGNHKGSDDPDLISITERDMLLLGGAITFTICVVWVVGVSVN